MLSRIQYLVEGIFQSSSRIFHRAGLAPNSLTVLGFLLWVVASILYWGGLSGWEWGAAVVVLVVAGFLDAVDGAMARKYAKVSKFGGVLDSVLDRLGEIAVYAGLAAGALISFWLALWAMSAALMVSYVRARVAAEGVTLKGIGLAERPERLLILMVATIFAVFNSLSLVIGVTLVALLSTATIVERLYRTRVVLSGSGRDLA